ncbi:hypothetical protein OH76DRAFT_1354126 [Lentinus brumalis]|uniref:Uncharacterized protein n=1 Tax=Lentinus brumalis TaxID=2498619 RepID=A0A371D4N9_9APHY|nr:hypothetical protein OH76DRAFT_1354126 [Polyporus brumalis]
MCHWRRVRNYYKRCRHYLDLPDEMIQCDDRHCKFSDRHPPDCRGARCIQTCWQYRQFPQQYQPVIDGYCSTCIIMGHVN